MMHLKTVVLIFFTILSFSSFAQSERELASHKAFKAFIYNNEKCKETMPIIVRSSSKDDFSKKYTQFQRLIAGIRVSLSFECKKVTSIIISGKHNGKEVYRGSASKVGDWVLIDIPVLKKEGLKQVNHNQKKEFTKVASPIVGNKITATSIESEKTPKKNPFSRFKTSSTNKKKKAEDSLSKQVNVFDRFKTSPASSKKQNNSRGKKSVSRKTGIDLSGYDYSGAIGALYTGNFSIIPDDQETRKYVFSVEKTYIENCTQQQESSWVSTLYVDRKLSEVLKKGAQGGLEWLAKDLLPTMAKGMEGYIEYGEKNTPILVEGLRDGSLFIERHGCYSKETKKLVFQIKKLINLRHKNTPKEYDLEQIKPLLSKRYKKLHNIKGNGILASKKKGYVSDNDIAYLSYSVFGFSQSDSDNVLARAPKSQRPQLKWLLKKLRMNNKARILVCHYQKSRGNYSDPYSGSPVVDIKYWHKKVPKTVAEITNVYSDKFITGLGKKGINSCPKTYLKGLTVLKNIR